MCVCVCVCLDVLKTVLLVIVQMGYKTSSQKTFLNAFSFWASCFLLVHVRREKSVFENIVSRACAVFTVIRFPKSGSLEETKGKNKAVTICPYF